MNAWFAIGLFDSPWVVAVVIIGSALANWVSKRRQEKQARHQSEGHAPPPPSNQPPGEFNLEEILRRLMGEEPPRPPAAPPLLPPPAHHEPPPAQNWSEATPRPPEPPGMPPAGEGKATARQPATHTVPVFRPATAIVLPPGSGASRAASRQEEQAARRFEHLNEQGRHPARVVSHTRQRAARSGPRAASRWRQVRSVRRAFVASLVFAPPKSFEP